MQIQWFPGHMHKASKEIKFALPEVDLLIEVLDARIPYSSQNPMLDRLRGDKPTIRVLNKADLADMQVTRRWQAYLESEEGVKTLVVNSQQPDRVRQIVELSSKMLPEKVAAGKIVRSMIMGIPNVGKSTIINILAGRVIAKTGNEPAVTKRQQKIHLGSHLVLSDTPGVLWPNVENHHSGYRLAVTGAVKDTAFEYDDIAVYALEYLAIAYPDSLERRYAIEVLSGEAGAVDMLSAIGQKRGCLKSGGIVDFDKAAKLFLNELRSGLLGAVTMETPEMAAAEKIEVEQKREAKALKKGAKKSKGNLE